MSTPQPAPEPQADAKPLRADAARNRAKVLDAARAAFAEHGRDAQMDDIARRAGVGVGTVYRHYPTKQSLALAMVQHRFDSIIAYIRETMIPNPDPWQAIVDSFDWCARTQLEDSSYAEAVAALAGGAPVTGGGPLGPCASQFDEMLELSAVYLARAHAAGVVRADLRPTDMGPCYAALSSIVQAGVEEWPRFVAILLDGLRAQPAEAAAS